MRHMGDLSLCLRASLHFFSLSLRVLVRARTELSISELLLIALTFAVRLDDSVRHCPAAIRSQPVRLT